MNKAQAIMHLFPTADPLKDFTVQDDSDGKGAYIAQWNVKDSKGKDIPEPTEQELEDAYIAYKISEEVTAYKEKRMKEYPPIGDQLDALWKMITPSAGSEAESMKVKIEAIKNKYPKP